MSCDHEDLNDDEDELTFLRGIQTSRGRMVRVVRPQGRTLYCTGCVITLRDL